MPYTKYTFATAFAMATAVPTAIAAAAVCLLYEVVLLSKECSGTLLSVPTSALEIDNIEALKLKRMLCVCL